jgi:hypothetical protein
MLVQTNESLHSVILLSLQHINKRTFVHIKNRKHVIKKP